MKHLKETLREIKT